MEKICYQTQINDQEECRSCYVKNLKQLFDWYVIWILDSFVLIFYSNFPDQTVTGLVWLMNQLNAQIKSLSSWFIISDLTTGYIIRECLRKEREREKIKKSFQTSHRIADGLFLLFNKKKWNEISGVEEL